ncbi:MAG: hypothetical protein KJ808_00190 [Acidobacteria bacterium]|nr:hypothetical protein [Acidobacteriota bacterium]MBU4306274.1 hypothetical protein [Acidobacteriota bacterium]MBU4405227.1 hypothetical protein [Acidobacteriota bacterium]MCG2809951.1 hypothetical protein [Candidatus Aminicenantes bacterium]
MGAKFIQKEVFWKNGNRKIEISRHTSSIDEGIVSFTSVGDGKQVQKEREKEIKEASDIL